ncbi:hypothetical protein ACR77U_13295 [Enterococcus faecium]|uniref:hypothetical protein n=1 Tax=Enterococcus faecium TaxID=1352 RepID=UPI003DA3DBE9
MMNLSVYTDGYFDLYDIESGEDELGTPYERIRKRDTGHVWFRSLAIFDRTRIAFDSADMTVQMKIRIPRWSGISSNCVCVIDGRQYKVYNKADVVTTAGVPETELTLIDPSVNYEVVEE